jgi:hypothetical protein
MLIPGAVFAGVIVTYAVERTNLWRRMPLEQYAVDFRRSLYRVDPMQPILLVVCAGGAVAFALAASGTARALAWVGVAQLAVVLVASLVVAEPMNSKFRRLTEGSVPPDAENLRDAWRRFHALRTVVALGALSCLVIAVTYV